MSAAVTEAQARTMLCCGPRPQCVGASCMAWRWMSNGARRSRIADDPLALDEPPRPKGLPVSWVWEPYNDDDGEPAAWVERPESAAARRVGRCGLVP